MSIYSLGREIMFSNQTLLNFDQYISSTVAIWYIVNDYEYLLYTVQCSAVQLHVTRLYTSLWWAFFKSKQVFNVAISFLYIQPWTLRNRWLTG